MIRGIVLMSLVACAGPAQERRSQANGNDLTALAAADLACPKDQLTQHPMGTTGKFEVHGCGKRAAYMWDIEGRYVRTGSISSLEPARSNPASSVPAEDNADSKERTP